MMVSTMFLSPEPLWIPTQHQLCKPPPLPMLTTPCPGPPDSAQDKQPNRYERTFKKCGQCHSFSQQPSHSITTTPNRPHTPSQQHPIGFTLHHSNTQQAPHSITATLKPHSHTQQASHSITATPNRPHTPSQPQHTVCGRWV